MDQPRRVPAYRGGRGGRVQVSQLGWLGCGRHGPDACAPAGPRGERVTRSGMDEPRIHPTAIVESGVSIGARTAVWDRVHLRGPSSIGHDCIIGEKTYIAYGVTVGNYVKIN